MKPTPPAYLPDLLRLHALGLIPPGEVTQVVIRHDDWCPELAGTGPCRCEPIVSVAPPPQEHA